jgi:YD repeat-containing protein
LRIVIRPIRSRRFQSANGSAAAPLKPVITHYKRRGTSFDLINFSAPGVAFDLTGPNGWTGFSNLVSDSTLMTLQYSGAYKLKAHGTGGSYNINYAFKLVETLQSDLALGTNFTGQFVGSGQAQLFRINVTNSGPLLVLLNNGGSGNHAELYLKFGSPPTRGDYDYRSTDPGAIQQILSTFAASGTWYVLVYGDYIPTPGAFTIQASSGSVFLSGITPDHHANNATLTMTITGAGFGGSPNVQLVATNGTTYPASTVDVDSFTQLTVTFASNTVPAGTYSVRATQPGGTAQLTNVFAMSGPGQPRLETRLIMPGALGRHAVATIYVEYANTGEVSMPAPLLRIQSSDPDGSDKPLLTLDPNRLSQGFWTSALPDGFDNTLQILASGATPGVLNPGERFQIPIYYAGLQQPWNFSDNQVEMEIRIFYATNSETLDWANIRTNQRPFWINQQAWEVVVTNLQQQIGATWGNLVTALDDDARYLGRLGQRVVSIGDLWQFEILRASDSFSPVGFLDGVTDANVPTPGLALDSSRSYGSDLVSRWSLGMFGWGWIADWDVKLILDADGSVSLFNGPNLNGRFQPDSRSGGYFSQSGDPTILTHDGAGYKLTKPTGLVTRFLADGRLDYVLGVDGSRVTATFTSNRLTRLTHSSSAFLAFAYNAAGLVETITDSRSRVTGYFYDIPNQHLIRVVYPDGHEVQYDYVTVPGIKQHSLTRIAGSGLSQNFEYDSFGRLSASFVGAGEQRYDYIYVSQAQVNIRDAIGVTESVWFNQAGRVTKAADGFGNATFFPFDQKGHLASIVSPTGTSRRFSWCDCGKLTGVADELGHTTLFAYGGPFDQLTAWTDPKGNTTRYEYDSVGHRTATTYPDSSREVWTYTSGRLSSFKNRRDRTVSYSYHPDGRLSRQSFQDGVYVDFGYDTAGRLTTINESDRGLTTYAYKTNDQVEQVSYPDGRFLQYEYDSFGRRRQMTNHLGFITLYAYDSAGQLAELRDGSSNIVVHYTYDGSGRLSREDKANGTYTTYGYDGSGQLSRNDSIEGCFSNGFWWSCLE